MLKYKFRWNYVILCVEFERDMWVWHKQWHENLFQISFFNDYALNIIHIRYSSIGAHTSNHDIEWCYLMRVWIHEIAFIWLFWRMAIIKRPLPVKCAGHYVQISFRKPLRPSIRIQKIDYAWLRLYWNYNNHIIIIQDTKFENVSVETRMFYQWFADFSPCVSCFILILTSWPKHCYSWLMFKRTVFWGCTNVAYITTKSTASWCIIRNIHCIYSTIQWKENEYFTVFTSIWHTSIYRWDVNERMSLFLELQKW